MAAVVGLNGQAETFASLNSNSSNDDHLHEVLQHVHTVLGLNDSCYAAKTCHLANNGSSKSATDATPDPGYVIKAVATGSRTKVFVNVCKKKSVERPSQAKQIARGGRSGLSWTIPHSLTEQAVNGSCRVFDFQVHPDACRMAETNCRFKNMLNELAIGAVAGEFNVQVNARKLQFPKIKYKSVQVLSQKKDAPMPQDSSETTAEVSEKGSLLNVSKQQNITLSADNRKSEVAHQKPKSQIVDANFDANNNKFTEPKYTVTLASDKEVPVAGAGSFLQALVVNIDLPLVHSAQTLSLYVFEKSLSLISTGHVWYKLRIDLPCVVDENHSFAKFVKSRRVLHVIMPMLTSSSTHSSSESSSVTLLDHGVTFVSESNLNTDNDDSACSYPPTEVECNQEADSICVSDEYTADEAVHCSTNMDNHVLQFSHRQDLETVSFVFSVKDVVPSSVSVNFISDRMCKIEMDKGASDGAAVSHVCYFLKFDEDCKCKNDNCTIDVTDASVMLIIAKASQCHHMWNTFWTGPDITHLEAYNLTPPKLTACDTESQLSSGCSVKGLDSEAADKCEKDCKDNSVDDSKVMMSDVEELRKSNEDISSEIVVVHTKGVPKLHGILKQQTMSESSDDAVYASVSGCERQASTTTCSEGDDNESSPDTSPASAVNGGRRVLKKSVSFNDHIDRTLFQANQSVSSMHAALKNRRRRARKRDQKQEQREQRRRRRSSGSFSLEESSDDQSIHVHAEEDSENCHPSAESSPDADACCSSFHVDSDKADCFYSHSNSDGTDIVSEKVSSTQDMCGSEFSSGSYSKNTCKNKNAKKGKLQKCKLTPDKAGSEGYNYSDTIRTTTSLLEGNSDREVNDGVSTATACDKPSLLHVLCNDEKCELETSSANETNDASLADGNGSQLAVLCSVDGAVEVLKSSPSNDNAASVSGYECQSSKKTAVLNMCRLCDLDVD